MSRTTTKQFQAPYASAKTGGVLHETCSAPPGLHTLEVPVPGGIKPLYITCTWIPDITLLVPGRPDLPRIYQTGLAVPLELEAMEAMWSTTIWEQQHPDEHPVQTDRGQAGRPVRPAVADTSAHSQDVSVAIGG